MTGESRYEVDLRERFPALERSAMLGLLMSAVVHEINNPLSVLLIGADQLRFTSSGGDGQESTVDGMVLQIERIVGIARKLQDMVRMTQGERQVVDLVELIPRFAQLEAWLQPDEASPSVDLTTPALPVEVDVDLLLQALRFVTRSMRVLWDGVGPLRIRGGVEDVALVQLPGLMDRQPRRTYVVLRLQRGEPQGESVPVKEMMADFFTRTRAGHEVELMAAWEVIRKAGGRMAISREPTSGIEVQVLLPLREARS